MERGEIHEVEETATISDGTAGGVEPQAITLASCLALIDESVLVSEGEIGEAMALLAEQERWIVEGSAGVALAGFLKMADEMRDARVAVVLCGRNIGFEKFLQAIR